METIASQVLISRLADWGVETVFGIRGDGINGIMEGLRRNADRVRFVLVHHEEAAAFMASAYGKATGRIGVCRATSGPGGIHLANGDVAVYNQMVVSPQQLPALVDLAIRHAYARRGVAHLCVPNDIQVAAAGEDPYQHVAPANPPSTAPVYLGAATRPPDDDLARAVVVLNSPGRTAILAGVGARGAGPLIGALAEKLRAPVVKTLPGKMVIGDDSPYTTGGIGLLGTAPSEDLMGDIDTQHGVRFGQPHKAAIATTVFKDKLQQLRGDA